MKKALGFALASSAVTAVFLIAFLAAAGTPSGAGSLGHAVPSAPGDIVSTPTTPTIGAPPDNPPPVETLPSNYTTGGSTCSGGHPVEYYFDFGDGTNSGWLPVETFTVAKRYAAQGSYNVRAKARCSVDTGLESSFSASLAANISSLSSIEQCFHVLPEAIWAPATGGGTWVTEVQLTAIQPLTHIYLCFNTAGGTWRGPFYTWVAESPNETYKLPNILADLQYLDPSFNYYGRVGAVEFWTQDAAHGIRLASRTSNGNYSKTFPGLRFNNESVVGEHNALLVQNLINNATYRSSAGFFNAGGIAMTVEFELLDSTGSLIGSAFSRLFAAYDFQSFNPFVQAGVPYPAYSYDNVILRAYVTSGDSSLLGFGALANNTSNDPAAMLTAMDAWGGGSAWNMPAVTKYLPEAIWAQATGGGTWTTDIQITDDHGGTEVEAVFCTASGTRGPFVLWTGGSAHSSVKFTNILQTFQALDPSFTYYGKVGAIYFNATQGPPYCFLVAAMTKNGNYAKTYPATSPTLFKAVVPGYDLMVQNLASDATYRSSVIFVNVSGISGSPGTVECRLRDATGNVIGSMFTVTLSPFRVYSVNPFAAAGVPYPANSYDNAWLHLTMPSAGGAMTVYGATANNASNDPAAHLPAMYNH